MMLRIFASILLLFSILFLPFWVSVILALLGMLYFSLFYEAVVLFLLSDLLYGAPEARLFNIFFFSFILSIIFLLVIEFLKKKLKFYKKNQHVFKDF
ncbi:MAG: hypothetical protein AAB493_00680 [Patescibacteria group bacterium]